MRCEPLGPDRAAQSRGQGIGEHVLAVHAEPERCDGDAECAVAMSGPAARDREDGMHEPRETVRPGPRLHGCARHADDCELRRDEHSVHGESARR